MATLKDEALCVRHWDWSETSQTVSLFTREHGIIRGLAKGAKRENANFSGGLELATRGEVCAIVKHGAADQALANLTAWNLTEVFPGVRRTLRCFHAAMGMLDFVHHGLIERDPHPQVYDALVESLRRLAVDGEEAHAALGFAWAMIDGTGHRPEVFVDLKGSGDLGEAALYGFDPRRGAVVDDPGEGAPVGGPLWRVRGETVRVLRRLASDGTVTSSQFAQGPITRALKLLCFYFRELVGVQPPALRMMLEGLTDGPGA